jgi:Uma2 family endonuclease
MSALLDMPRPADPPGDDWGHPDDRVFEYINGVEVEKQVGARETFLANRLSHLISGFARPRGLGDAYAGMEIELPVSGNRCKPDVCFVSADAWPLDRLVPDAAWWPIAPDLAVESVSPRERAVITQAKVHGYFAGGVRVVWLIFPGLRTVHRYLSPTDIKGFTAADTLTADPVLPGFALPLADLFPPADPLPG